jgi:tetratricopeptide (TPR) repeat protein
MALQTEKDLSEQNRALWQKSLQAYQVKNYGYTISLVQTVLKEAPGFLEARKILRRAEITHTKGKKAFMSGLSAATLKGGSLVKKDPLAAMELAEKSLETDPFNIAVNNLLKDAAKAAGYPEIAAFAMETIVEGNPKDTKMMHELGEYYTSTGDQEKAVKIYTRIVEINPADLVANKMSKDSSARATMKSGGWDTAKSYRDVIKNKGEAEALEQKSRVVKSTEMIDTQIAEIYAQWEQDQQNADLSRRLARLWEDRYELELDAESIQGAIYFYSHTNQLTSGTDPAVARRLSDLQLKQLDDRIKALQDWFAAGGDQHPDAAQYRQELDDLVLQKSESLITEARKRVERNPTDLQLRYELGERLVAAKQFTEAITELQRARQNPAARLKAMNLLGQCYTEKGMLDLAVKQLKDAASEILAMDTTKKEILYKLGQVYEKMGKKEESLDCMKQIYEVDYGYLDVAHRVESSYAG